jgi:hypothetical protein
MARHSLIAAATTAISSASAVAASSAIAATGVTGTTAIPGVAESGMIAAVPMSLRVRTGMASIDAAETIAAVAEIAGAVRSRPVRKPLPVFCWTFLPLREQQQADQESPADRDANRRYFARHVVALRLHPPPIVHCKNASNRPILVGKCGAAVH